MKNFRIIFLLNIFTIIPGMIVHGQIQSPTIPFIKNVSDTVVNEQGYLYWVLVNRHDNINLIKEFRNGSSRKNYSMKYWVMYDSLKRIVSIKSNGKRNSPEVGPGLRQKFYTYDYLNRVIDYSEYEKKWFNFKLKIHMVEDFDNRTLTVYQSEYSKVINYKNVKGIIYKRRINPYLIRDI